MRLLPLILLLPTAWLSAVEPQYPLWDGQESVADYAKRVNLPTTKMLDLGNGVMMELVLIPAGKFIMGTPEPAEPAETAIVGQTILVLGIAAVLLPLLIIAFRARKRKQRANFSLLFLLALVLAASVAVYGGVRWHKTNEAWGQYAAAMMRYEALKFLTFDEAGHLVTLTRPFYMGKYTVTQEQYEELAKMQGQGALMGANWSGVKGKNNPVENLYWHDAQEFCRRLSLSSRCAARLPSEAEWEFACGAGRPTTYFNGDTEADLDRAAWYDANSKKTTHPVGQKASNEFGLYDMHGNVRQWCQDRYEIEFYSHSTAENPMGSVSGTQRVVRGGSWNSIPLYCRTVNRSSYSEGFTSTEIGFRVVVEVAASTQ